MIGRLRGTLEAKYPLLLIDVGGVGYEVEVPLSTFSRLPEIGAMIVLHTHLVVREDAQLLYGFASDVERRLFRELLRISGVGAKLALAILSGFSADEFASCVQEGDTAALARLPGVGKKTAERLVVEMRDRLGDLDVEASVPDSGRGALQKGAGGDARRDAVGALITLGYKPPEANRLVNSVAAEGDDSEKIIRTALQQVVR